MKHVALLILAFFLFIKESSAQLATPTSIFGELFAGPGGAIYHDSWLSGMKEWRSNERNKLNYNDSWYTQNQLTWAKKTFVFAQVMAHDRYLFNEGQGKYTVERYLNDLKTRYGGLDAVLVWPTYPNIGVDNRNQFDLLHDMPGGIKGVKQMIVDFQKRGVRVFFPIMAWDYGTRDVLLPMNVALVKEMKTLGADGLNGDTMTGVTEDYKNASDSLNYPLSFQPEVFLKDLKMIEWNNMSWGYWWKGWTDPSYNYEPGVSVYKWLEPRHQVSVTNRWAIDKTNDLQYAFFNGVGYNAWENIWGIWNQVPERYAEIIRRMATIYRQFPNVWSNADWEPFIPVSQHGIFASKFPNAGKTVYTFINRDSVDRVGIQIQLPYVEGMKYYDLWNGTALNPNRAGNQVNLNFSIEGNGYGAVLVIKSSQLTDSLNHFLKKMSVLSEKPLKNYSATWSPLKQKITPIKKTKSFGKTPSGMILVPAGRNYLFESKGVMIEGDAVPEAIGVQHPWEQHPARSQKHAMDIPAFYIDTYPVTNQQYKKFIEATHYRPKDDHNFLKDWKNQTYPKGWDDKPVTWISIEDARAYAKWAGKRLPHEWEWQYAAQGIEGNLYPWGNNRDTTRIPLQDTSRNMREPTSVKQYTLGATPSKIMDLVGNVWQWTDEYVDSHSRFAIVKGGSYYRAQTSGWYFPQAHELNKYGKYLLMSPSLDRAGTIGFRCVADK